MRGRAPVQRPAVVLHQLKQSRRSYQHPCCQYSGSERRPQQAVLRANPQARAAAALHTRACQWPHASPAHQRPLIGGGSRLWRRVSGNAPPRGRAKNTAIPSAHRACSSDGGPKKGIRACRPVHRLHEGLCRTGLPCAKHHGKGCLRTFYENLRALMARCPTRLAGTLP